MIHKPLPYADAERILSDVHHTKHFHTKKGVIVKNVNELKDQLQQMDDAEFSHHVNTDKNDFKEWVQHVVNDSDLADQLGKCRTRKAMLAILDSRIDHLHQIKHGPVFPHQQYLDYALYDFLGGIIVGLVVGLVITTLV